MMSELKLRPPNPASEARPCRDFTGEDGGIKPPLQGCVGIRKTLAKAVARRATGVMSTLGGVARLRVECQRIAKIGCAMQGPWRN